MTVEINIFTRISSHDHDIWSDRISSSTASCGPPRLHILGGFSDANAGSANDYVNMGKSIDLDAGTVGQRMIQWPHKAKIGKWKW